MLDSGVFCNRQNLFVVFANVQNIILRMFLFFKKQKIKNILQNSVLIITSEEQRAGL